MRRHSPPYHSPPRRGHGGRGRSPPRRGYGGHGGRKEQGVVSLLVRNIPLSCRPEDLRVTFERFGPVQDVYLPRDYYSGEPRGFAFVEFVDSSDASEAQYHMNRRMFSGREITVVLAAESRKRPEDMRRRTRVRGYSDHEGHRTSRYGRSRSRSRSRSHSPHHRGCARSRSYSPAPRRLDDYSASPKRKEERGAKSPRQSKEHDVGKKRRSYTPDDRNDRRDADNGYKALFGRAPDSHFSDSAPDSLRIYFSENLELSVESVWLVGWLQESYEGGLEANRPCYPW